MRTFVFNIDKAVAAAAYVTRRKQGRRISIFELLKTMYAAERVAREIESVQTAKAALQRS
jgi:hypothetical protein